jgi:hypothetical protein
MAFFASPLRALRLKALNREDRKERPLSPQSESPRSGTLETQFEPLAS